LKLLNEGTAAEEQTATTSEISSNTHQVVHQTSQGVIESDTAAAQLSCNAAELQHLAHQLESLNVGVTGGRMKKLEWDESFKIGSSEIDQHHKHLFELFEKTHEGFINGTPNLGPIFDELIDYARYHFKSEEIWMMDKYYPDATNHRSEHNSFLLRVQKKQMAFHSGQEHISMGTLLFLREWITNHILNTDVDFGKFLKDLERVGTLVCSYEMG